MEKNEREQGADALPRHPVFWVLAALGLAVFALVVGWNLRDADLPLLPGGDAAHITSVTTSR